MKFPGGVTTPEPGCDAANVHETNGRGTRLPGSTGAGAGTGSSAELGLTAAQRHAQGSALGTSKASTHRRLTADCSIVTTPTSTAPGAACASITNGATEKKGKASATLQKRVTARRGGTAGQTRRGKGAERITASEYAKQKNAEVEERRLSGKKTNAKQFLEGMRIFYYGNDMGFPSEDTIRRMDIVSGHSQAGTIFS